ncbi:hypothetical protein QQX64_23945, partial [Klebsiella pneumoniae]
LMMSLWDALRMNMMISYQELVRTFPIPTLSTHGHVNQRPDAVNKKFIGGNDNNHNVFPYTLLL